MNGEVGGAGQAYSVTLGERNKEVGKRVQPGICMLLSIKPLSVTIIMPCIAVKVSG